MPNIKFKSLCLRFLYLSMLMMTQVSFSQIVTGTFTGDGNATQAVTGLGFQPDVLLVIPSTGGAETGDVQTWLNTSTMPSDEVKFTIGGNSVANAFQTDHLSSIDSDGFTVATKSNTSSTLYYYVAWSDDDGSVTTGTVSGSTSAATVITGYEPGMVWLIADNVSSPDYVKWTVSARPTGTYRFSHGEGGWGEHMFNAFSPIGFQLRTSGSAGSGVVESATYHYVAFQGAIETANPGWGSGPDKVTTAVEPGFIMTRHSSTAGNNTYIKTAEMPDGESFIPRHETAETNALLDFESDGYTVGSTGQLRDKHYYYVAEVISALPVELTKFQGQEIDGETFLNWTTAAEINNDYFEVLASNDGVNWESIKIVNGAGNSSVELNYAVNLGADNHKFYKLKQVDFDGSFDYSNVIYLKRSFTANAQLLLFPNPANDRLNIVTEELEGNDFNIKVFDVKGAIVKSGRSLNFNSGNVVSINLEGLAKGVYTVSVSNELGFQLAQRFIKK